MTEKLTHPAVITFIKEHLAEDSSQLMLRAKQYPELPMRDIVTQIASRQKARSKLPEWFAHDEIVFPPKENLEQASSEITARFKARQAKGDSFIDLTGGTGVDAYYLGKNFKKRTFVEPEAGLCELAVHNFKVLGFAVDVINQDAEAFLNDNKEQFDLIYLDPSRRDQNRQRVFKLEDSEPDILSLYKKITTVGRKILIKASPMQDIKSALEVLPGISKVQVLAVENDVKELLFWIEPGYLAEPCIEASSLHISNSDHYFSFTHKEEKEASPTYGDPEEIILVPDSAVMKTQPFNLLSQKFDIRKLHPQTHLYTSDAVPQGFPGRAFRIIAPVKLSGKELRKVYPDQKVNVLIRNFPMGANEIKKNYQLKDGGDEFLICCTLYNGKKAAFRCLKA